MTPNSHDDPAHAGGVQETTPAAGGEPEPLAARAQRFFFGDDVFVSYARHDSDYALRLADELTRRNLSCFLDQWGTPPGVELPPELVARLKKSTLLVVVGTRRAAASENVMKEVLEFKKTGRPIIPITFVDEEVFASIRDGRIPEGLTGTLEEASWYEQITGIARTVESRAALKAGREGEAVRPSPQVITRVVNAEGFVSRSRRLRRVFKTTLASLFALLVAAGVVTTLLVLNAQDDMNKALEQQKQAESKATEAEGKRAAAECAQADAELARADAEGKTKKAQADLTVAQAETKRAAASLVTANINLHIALTQQKNAQALAEEAKLDAKRQQEVALTRRLANQSSLTLRQKPELLARSVSLAVESAKRSHDLGVRSLESDTALRESLGLLPRWLEWSGLEDHITSAAFSPGAETVVTLSKPQGAGDGEEVLTVRRASDGEAMAAPAPCKSCGAIAVSRGGDRVATRVWTEEKEFVRVKETKGARVWDVPVENSDDSAAHVALSPDGKYLLMALMNADSEAGERFAELWSVEKQTRVARLSTNGYLRINSVAFSPGGKYFAVAGGGIGARGRDVGRTLVWNTTFATDANDLKARDLRGPEVFAHEGGGTAVAIDDDGRHLATASGPTALVWVKADRGGFEQIGRIPLGREIEALAFDADAKTLSTLSSVLEWTGGGPVPTFLAATPKALDVWDFKGYWEEFRAPHTAEIEGLVFAPGGESVITVSDTHAEGEGRLKVWKASDGTEDKAASLLPKESGESPAALSEDARYVVTDVRDEGWRVWDVRARRPIALPAEPGYERLEQPVLRPDGAVMARAGRKVGSQTYHVITYKLDGGAYEKTGEWPVGEWPGEFLISPAHDYLVFTQEEPVGVRRLSDGADIAPDELNRWGEVKSVKISPTGNLFAAVTFEGGGRYTVRVWDVRRGREVKSVAHDGPVTSFALSPNDRYLALGYDDGLVRVFDLKGDAAGEVRHDGPVGALAFSPDERYLGSGDELGMMRVVETNTLEEVARMPHFGLVTGIAFSADGRRVAATTKAPDEDNADSREANVLHVWLLNPTDLIREACGRLEIFSEGAKNSPYCKGT